ncbi:MAG: hypothetical protein HY482_00920 [Candidatus Wildermuthbacteria bacterium]|nr:hypothetical protein [Candidatus Wildermuthbacteria bacterium]
MKKVLAAAALFCLFVLPVSADARLVSCGASVDDTATPTIDETQSCKLCNLFDLVYSIINLIFFTFVPIVLPIFIVIGGFYFLIARGDPAMLTKGKTILTATVTGLIITYAAWVALNTILSFLGVADWTGLGSWWHINCATT